MFGGSKTKYCNKCNKEITVNNYNKHQISCNSVKEKKIRGVDFDPNSGYKDGSRSAWNKGLTKDTDVRVKKYSKTNIGNKKIGKCVDPQKEFERRQKLSKSAKNLRFGGYRPNAGRSKKFKVIDSFGTETTLQSTYELLCSELLNELGIKWIRPKTLKYDGKNYFADFYLTEYDIYLDPKNNYKAKQDEEKIRKVIEQNDVKVFVLTKDMLNIEFLTSVIQ